MGTLLPLKRKEIGNELPLYYTLSALGNVHCQCFRKTKIIFCQTMSKTPEASKQNKIIAITVQRETG